MKCTVDRCCTARYPLLDIWRALLYEWVWHLQFRSKGILHDCWHYMKKCNCNIFKVAPFTSQDSMLVSKQIFIVCIPICRRKCPGNNYSSSLMRGSIHHGLVFIAVCDTMDVYALLLSSSCSPLSRDGRLHWAAENSTNYYDWCCGRHESRRNSTVSALWSRVIRQIVRRKYSEQRISECRVRWVNSTWWISNCRCSLCKIYLNGITVN